MKYIFVFFYLFFLSIIAYSQEVFPLANAQWTEEFTYGENPHYTTILYRYFLQGDTVIDNIKRSKLYFIRDINKRDTLLFGYFYVKDQVVYYRDASEYPPYYGSSQGYLPLCYTVIGKDYPLYDFSLEKGDTYDGCIWQSIVSSVDSVLIEGVEHKRITFNAGGPYWMWIEGIGNTLGLFNDVQEIPTGEAFCQLVCFSYNDIVLYLNPTFSECPQADFSSIDKIEQSSVNIFFNPTEHTISITSPYLISQVKIFNASGVLLQEDRINGKFQTIVHAEHLPKTGVCVAQIVLQDGRTVNKKIINQ